MAARRMISPGAVFAHLKVDAESCDLAVVRAALAHARRTCAWPLRVDFEAAHAQDKRDNAKPPTRFGLRLGLPGDDEAPMTWFHRSDRVVGDAVAYHANHHQTTAATCGFSLSGNGAEAVCGGGGGGDRIQQDRWTLTFDWRQGQWTVRDGGGVPVAWTAKELAYADPWEPTARWVLRGAASGRKVAVVIDDNNDEDDLPGKKKKTTNDLLSPPPRGGPEEEEEEEADSPEALMGTLEEAGYSCSCEGIDCSCFASRRIIAAMNPRCGRSYDAADADVLREYDAALIGEGKALPRRRRASDAAPPTTTHATKEEGEEAPYVVVVGCGYSMTKSVARLLTEDLGVPVSHEGTSPEVLAQSGVVAWQATVLRYGAEPRDRAAAVIALVRDPLGVIRSSRATEHLWCFESKNIEQDLPAGRHGGERAQERLAVVDWVPEEVRRFWVRFPRDVKALAWWCSFTLLAQRQAAAPVVRVEDVFDRGDVGALRRAIAAARVWGTKNATAQEEEEEEETWAALGDAARRSKPLNRHAVFGAPRVTWTEVRNEIDALEDDDTRHAAMRVFKAARGLAADFGYPVVDRECQSVLVLAFFPVHGARRPLDEIAHGVRLVLAEHLFANRDRCAVLYTTPEVSSLIDIILTQDLSAEGDALSRFLPRIVDADRDSSSYAARRLLRNAPHARLLAADLPLKNGDPLPEGVGRALAEVWLHKLEFCAAAVRDLRTQGLVVQDDAAVFWQDAKPGRLAPTTPLFPTPGALLATLYPPSRTRDSLSFQGRGPCVATAQGALLVMRADDTARHARAFHRVLDALVHTLGYRHLDEEIVLACAAQPPPALQAALFLLTPEKKEDDDDDDDDFPPSRIIDLRDLCDEPTLECHKSPGFAGG